MDNNKQGETKQTYLLVMKSYICACLTLRDSIYIFNLLKCCVFGCVEVELTEKWTGVYT